jgi:acetoin utilization deacetylase AcuC-like enzyme
MALPRTVWATATRALRPWLRLARRTKLQVWFHPQYRLRCPELVTVAGIEPRRAEMAVWAVQAERWGRSLDIQTPGLVSWQDLQRVHTAEHIERCTVPRELGRMFGVDSDAFPADSVLLTLRHAVQGTIEAARAALAARSATFNLLGGFHHGFPDKGGGFCPFNDVAVAIAVLRAEGFRGRVVVLDLDAHPPDGTDACLVGDAACHIASISCVHWAPLQRADETVLGARTRDGDYLRALTLLLARTPPADLVFVLAGSDVRDGDRMGTFSLTDDGVRARDAAVRRWLGKRAAVWLPAGGYRSDAWLPLAEQVLGLLDEDALPITPGLDPLEAHFGWIGARFDPGPDEEDDLEDLFRPTGPRRLLGYYTHAGVEVGLEQYGVLSHLRELGYQDVELHIDHAEPGDRLRVTAEVDGVRQVLIEGVLAIEPMGDQRWLFVHWLTMRHPRGVWLRDPLPGQAVPGLGLGREAFAILRRMADRLGLAGVMFRPAQPHIALAASPLFHFLEPARQATFDALVRDLGALGPVELSRAVVSGQVRCNGERWLWPAEPMVDGPQPVGAPAAEQRFTRCLTEPSTEPALPPSAPPAPQSAP